VKPLDSLRLRRAATTILDGGTVQEGILAESPVGAESPRQDEVSAG
jgi:hypothetical protein